MKYKLIKEYPGSPKLSTVIEWRNLLGGYWAYRISDHESVPNWQSIPITEPKNHPEFWEEIVEKDYEILSIYSGNTILNDSNVKTWEKFKSFRGVWNIHSVKRLSDGEI